MNGVYNDNYVREAIDLLTIEGIIFFTSLYRLVDHNTCFIDLLTHLDECLDEVHPSPPDGGTLPNNILQYPDSITLLGIFVDALTAELFAWLDERLKRFELDATCYEASAWHEGFAHTLIMQRVT